MVGRVQLSLRVTGVMRVRDGRSRAGVTATATVGSGYSCARAHDGASALWVIRIVRVAVTGGCLYGARTDGTRAGHTYSCHNDSAGGSYNGSAARRSRPGRPIRHGSTRRRCRLRGGAMSGRCTGQGVMRVVNGSLSVRRVTTGGRTAGHGSVGCRRTSVTAGRVSTTAHRAGLRVR